MDLSQVKNFSHSSESVKPCAQTDELSQLTEILIKSPWLSDDEDKILNRIAKNHTSHAVLRMIYQAESTDTYLHGILALNPAAPEDILEALSTSESNGVRSLVAQNPSTPERILYVMAQDPSVARHVSYNPSASADLLQALHDTGDREVMSGVAKHTSTPRHILEEYVAAGGGLRFNAIANPAYENIAGVDYARIKGKVLNLLEEEGVSEHKEQVLRAIMSQT